MDKTKRALLHLELPNDLIVLILMRLPVKSFLRFKCVSKFFFSLISDNQFTKQHFDFVVSPTHRLFYLAGTDSGYISRLVDLSASSLHNHNDSVALIPPFLPRLCIPQIVGACNGFVLLCDRFYDLYIWNPSTGVHKKLPRPPIALSKSYRERHDPNFYGFGHDASTDDYLMFLATNDFRGEHRKIDYELFSLRANAWNTIEGNHFPYLFYLRRQGIFLNGVLHWLVYRRNIQTRVILAFDLREKSFSEVPLPPPVVDFYNSKCYDICVFDGYLCLMIHVSVDNATEIWVMNEYNVWSSWKKYVELFLPSEASKLEKYQMLDPLDRFPYHYISPRYSTKCGDIVGVNRGTRVVKFNAKGQLLEYHSYLDDHDHRRVYSCEAIMYTESLLWFPS